MKTQARVTSLWALHVQDVWMVCIGPYSDSQLHDGEASWQRLSAAGQDLPVARQSCAAEYADNCLFIAGGYADAASKYEETPLVVWLNMLLHAGDSKHSCQMPLSSSSFSNASGSCHMCTCHAQASCVIVQLKRTLMMCMYWQ